MSGKNLSASVSKSTETVKNAGQFSADHLSPKRYYAAAPCEGPGCNKIVPAGFYPAQRVRAFCSNSCRNRDTASRYVAGICRYEPCGKTVFGRKDEVGKKHFCCEEHQHAYETERVLGPTGPFRKLIEEYMATSALAYYKTGTLHAVRSSLAAFFRHVVQTEQISRLEEIGPAVITRFIVVQCERGLTSRNYVGHIATFFRVQIAEERYRRANPVVARIHYQRNAFAEARPYNDADLQMIWECVERSGKTELMLAFSIGEECGLRIGEVCNIRLSDIDMTAQTIFVRLPTKNSRTRKVPFHGKVKKYLALWLKERDPRCTFDNLLHNNALTPFVQNTLDLRFKNLLSKESAPANSFNFHRLRHTWATRLMNNGMELAVLKVLGGWEKWNSMQRYIRVLEGTVRSQYEKAYQKLQESKEIVEEETLSLLDFALMNDDAPSTPIASAT